MLESKQKRERTLALVTIVTLFVSTVALGWTVYSDRRDRAIAKGEEQFFIVTKSTSSLDEAKLLCERLRGEWRKPSVYSSSKGYAVVLGPFEGDEAVFFKKRFVKDEVIPEESYILSKDAKGFGQEIFSCAESSLPPQNYYILVKSTDQLREAAALARRYLDSKHPAMVHESSGGIYAITLGPFPSSEASDILVDYKKRKIIPEDSILLEENAAGLLRKVDIPESGKRDHSRVFVISVTTPSEVEAKRQARKLVAKGLEGAEICLTESSGYVVAFGPFPESVAKKFRADAISRNIMPDDAYFMRDRSFRKKIPYGAVVEKRFLHVVAYSSFGQARSKVDFFLRNGLKAEAYLNNSDTYSVVINTESRREALQVKRAAESNGLVEDDTYLVDRGELLILVYPKDIADDR